jgi:MFS family permease
MTWRDSFLPLRERNFAWYYASRFVDMVGTMMGSFALTFAVLAVTGNSATAVGQVLAARTVPMVLFMLFGGVIADRLPRALVLQTSNLAAALSQGLLAYLVITGRADLRVFLVLAFVNGTADAMGFPAMASMVPQLVKRELLQSANALISLSRGALTIAAPTIGALLVVTVGPGWALAINTGTWLASAVFLTGVRIPPKPAKPERTSTVQDLREGLAMFVRTTWLWVIVLAFTFINAIQSGAWFTLGPTLAKQTIGEQGWGLVLSTGAAGIVVMTVILLRVRLRRPLVTGMLAISAMSAPLIVLGLDPWNLPLLIAVAFFAGAGIEVFNISWSVAMQENIEDHMLSRAYSYDELGSVLAMPIGQLAYGPLGEAFGYRDVLLVSGLAYLGICLLTLLSGSVRNLGRADAEQEPQPALG